MAVEGLVESIPTSTEAVLKACGGLKVGVVFSFNLSPIFWYVLNLQSMLFSMGIKIDVGVIFSVPLTNSCKKKILSIDLVAYMFTLSIQKLSKLA